MLRLLLAPIAAITMLGGDTDKPALRLKVGDSVTITGPYGGDFVIQQDGAIYGRGFGRLVLEGKTWSEGQSVARKALKPYVLETEVFLTIKQVRQEVVYLVGASGRGPVELTPNLSLRQLLASAQVDKDADLMEAQVFRGSTRIRTVNVGDFLASTEADEQLQPNDVITLSPTAFVRVWVTGLVAKSGQLKLPAGTDAYKAIAEAGGFHAAESGMQQDETKIVVRRGPETIELPAKQNAGSKPIVLEAGDTVVVTTPEIKRITVAGEVERPGEVVVRGDSSLMGVIALAGGPTDEGTLTNVMVLRQGELYNFDVTASISNEPAAAFTVQAGDLLVVQKNQDAFQVLGEVGKPGKFLMANDRTYRLSDALALAGGLSPKGTLRRVFLSRAGANGKVVVTQYNLDEYLKDGRIESNPKLQPGDCVLFTTPKGVTIGVASQLLSGALLFDSLAGGK